MNKVRLRVLGISYSQTQSGAYALVLKEENGNRRIPIIIRGFEAQAIAIQMEGLKPPRPLTHDLFLSLASAYNISLVEIFIHRLENGVFHCEIVCENQNTRVKIDSRTSDAVALALRFNCPIYTTEDILQKAGIAVDIEQEERQAGVKKKRGSSKRAQENDEEDDTIKKEENPFESFSDEELQELLEDAIEKEDYEFASHIRDEINRRKTQRGGKK